MTTKMKILIVDDDLICLKALENLLSRHYSCSISSATTATEALNTLNSMSLDYDNQGFDLILMDIHLPDVSGDILTSIIRKTQKQEKHTPIIAITAHPKDLDKHVFEDLGLTDLILKPVTADVLNTMIKKYTQHTPRKSAH